MFLLLVILNLSIPFVLTCVFGLCFNIWKTKFFKNFLISMNCVWGAWLGYNTTIHSPSDTLSTVGPSLVIVANVICICILSIFEKNEKNN